jgi:hypothetical protein
VRSGPAKIRNEAAELVLLELNDICGREISGYENQIVLIARDCRRSIAGLAKQHFHQPFYNLDNVGLALAQVTVLDLVELLEQRIHLHLERPLGVA